MAVILSYRKNKGGDYTIYYEINENGVREKKHSLGLKVSKPYKQWERVLTKDRDNMTLAKKKLTDIESAYNHKRLGFEIPQSRNIDIFPILRGMLDGKHHPRKNPAYKCSLDRFEEYYRENRKAKFTQQIYTKNLLSKFCEYLIDTRSQTTASTYLNNLKTLTRKAIRANLLPKTFDPFEGLEIPKKERLKNIVYLTKEEVELIYKLKPKNKKEEVFKDAFVFSCLTGLRIGDIRTLENKEIFKNEDGYFLKIKMEKTDRFVTVDFNDAATKIYEKYKSDSNLLFEVMNVNFKYNAQTSDAIRKIAKRAKIDKHLTYHVSRHTFGTLLINNDVPLVVVQELMGHTTSKMTLLYAQILGKTRKKAVNKISINI